MIEGTVIGTVGGAGNHETDDYIVTLLKCPACGHAIVAHQQGLREVVTSSGDGLEVEFSRPRTVWPKHNTDFAPEIPYPIWRSLLESRQCLLIGAYTASVAMSGRSLEALCRTFHTGTKPDTLTLHEGIEELFTNKIIDDRLYTWSRELRLDRNLAAHASGQDFTQQDAEDLYQFTSVICDYVFVLREKFRKFQERSSLRRLK